MSKRILSDQNGAAMVEFTLLISLLLVSSIFALKIVGRSVNRVFEDVTVIM